MLVEEKGNIIFLYSSYSTSEDRSIINSFLTEMDGFVQNENIFVLGATNDVDNLDQAALRPGRFDKILHIPKPDKKGRSEIFNLYLNKITNIKLSEDLTNEFLSTVTPGFSGAEIQNIVNLALIEAVDSNSETISKKHFQEAIDRTILGIKYKYKKSKTLRYLLQKAIHEAGHTLVCYKNTICKNSLHKSSISSRGSTEGTTSYILSQEDMDDTKQELAVLIDVSVAGIVAEELYFGDNKISTGCGKDINRAYSYAESMVKRFGMSPLDYGYMVIKEQHFQHKISGETRIIVDSAASDIIEKSSVRVRNILNENINDLLKLTRYLLEYEELDKNDIFNILEGKELDERKMKLRSVNLDNIKI
jgi:ATP-dependent metalloprotease